MFRGLCTQSFERYAPTAPNSEEITSLLALIRENPIFLHDGFLEIMTAEYLTAC